MPPLKSPRSGDSKAPKTSGNEEASILLSQFIRAEQCGQMATKNEVRKAALLPFRKRLLATVTAANRVRRHNRTKHIGTLGDASD